MNTRLKSLLFWMALMAVGVVIWNVSTNFQARDRTVTFSEFLQWVDSRQVESVTIRGSEITGMSTGGENFRTYAPLQYEGLANQLIDRDVTITARDETGSAWTTVLYYWAPILMIIAFSSYFMRQVQSGGNKALSFGKSRANLSSSTQK